MAKIKEIKTKLLEDINLLKNKKYGFLEAGLPRFGRLFGRDSIISAWQLLNVDSKIAKNTIEILSKFQGKKIDSKREEEPGKILHEHQIGKKRHPEGFFSFPYYGSVDSTPLFLILFSEYFKKTNNREFVGQHWKNILGALHWLFHFGDKDNDLFLEYKRQTKKGLFHQGWKDGFKNHLKIAPPVAIVEVQGYQYLALIEIGKIAKKVFGDTKLKLSLLKRAKKIKEKFNKKFWMPRMGYFALALDGTKKQRRAITSNPGHLLFTGICQKEKERLVVRRLFQKDLWTPYGIRTHSTLEPDFDPLSYHLGSVWPHDNWIIAQGLKKLSYQKEYLKIKNALLLAYKKIGYIPEFYGVSLKGEIIIDNLETKPCHPQAWASGALLNFLFS
jgi:glycogen debranching enzyme